MRIRIAALLALAAGPAAAQSPGLAALAVDLPAARACLLRPADLDHDLPAIAALLAAGRGVPLTAITRDTGSVKLEAPSAARPDPRDYRSWAVAVSTDATIPWALAPLHGKPARAAAVEDVPVTAPEAIDAVAAWLKDHQPAARPALRRAARWEQPGLGTVTLAWSWAMPAAGAAFDPAQHHSLLVAAWRQGGRSGLAELGHGALIADLRVEVGLAAVGDVDGSGVPAILMTQIGQRTVYTAFRLDSGPGATVLGFCAVAGR